MNKKEILALINEAHIGFLATLDDKVARVRCMETYRADENGLIFYTGKTKRVGQQLIKNPDIEVCYFHKGIQVRVRGRMEFLEDDSLKKEIVCKREFLLEFLNGDLSSLLVCRLRGKVNIQNLGITNAYPAVFTDF